MRGMLEIKRKYLEIEKSIKEIKTSGLAWSYIGSGLSRKFYEDLEEIELAIKDAKEYITK